uniref:Melanocortin 3 receptor n=1 Tax=Oncorhynchus tshawytscha TaxID=74940 RepID=A0A8C8GMW5_ONCTS
KGGASSSRAPEEVLMGESLAREDQHGNWTGTGIEPGLGELVHIQAEVFLTLGIVSLLENILVISVMVKNKNLHSPMYVVFCSLAAADMLVSVSNSLETVVIAALNSRLIVADDHFIQLMDNFFDSTICISLVASICNLLIIAIDCYVTIFYALRYHSIVSKRRALLVMGGGGGLHRLLREQGSHCVSDHHVLHHAGAHGRSVRSHVSAGEAAHQAHRCSACRGRGAPEDLHEGSGHHHHSSGGVRLLLGTFLPPPHPPYHLSQEPTLCLLHVPLHYLPGAHHV